MEFQVLFLITMCFKFVISIPHCEITNFGNSYFKHDTIHAIYLTENNTSEVELILQLMNELTLSAIDVDLIISSPENFQIKRDVSNKFVQDNGLAWKELGKKNGHFFTFDRCGKLTYEVIKKMVREPYVKAAIFSTFFEDPCGGCENVQPTLKSIFVPHMKNQDLFHHQSFNYESKKLPVYPAFIGDVIESVVEADEDGTIPIRIVLKKPHTHVGDNRRYDHIEIFTSNANYHGHLEDDQDWSLEESDNTNQIQPENEINLKSGEKLESKSKLSNGVQIMETKLKTDNKLFTKLKLEDENHLKQVTSHQSKTTFATASDQSNGTLKEANQEESNLSKLRYQIDVNALNNEVNQQKKNEEEYEHLLSHYKQLFKWLDYLN